MIYNKNILVTGGTGMVGKHLQELLPEATYIGSSIDLRDWINVDALFAKLQPTRVIHLAAKVGGIVDNVNNPAEFYEDNVLMNTNLIKAAKKYNVERFTGMLSTCIYPDVVENYPMKEEDLFIGPPAETNLSYAYSKRVMAVHINSYNKQYGKKYNYLVAPNLYSEHDNFEHGEKMHFITALLKKIRNAEKQESKYIELLGTGKPLRQFMYAKDLAVAIKEMVDNDITESFNVAPTFNYSINEMANMAIEALDKNIEVKYPSKSLDGQYRKDVSSEKMLSILPKFKFTEFKEGIKKVYGKI